MYHPLFPCQNMSLFEKRGQTEGTREVPLACTFLTINGAPLTCLWGIAGTPFTGCKGSVCVCVCVVKGCACIVIAILCALFGRCLGLLCGS